jgi:predicted peptidase
VEGVSHRYRVYVPAEYTRARRWPVILFLHGSGERGADGILQTSIGLGDGIRRHAERWPAIVVFPQAPIELRWFQAFESPELPRWLFARSSARRATTAPGG